MSATLTTALKTAEGGRTALGIGLAGGELGSTPEEFRACFHCGQPCPDDQFAQGENAFCCQGCRLVHDLLAEAGLGEFYELERHPGTKVREALQAQWAYLDESAVQQKILDFTDGKLSRVTFHIPAIRCVACVWLLEHLFRLHSAVGASQVNFGRRELSVSYAAEKLRLSELVALLASIGYEPALTLEALEERPGASGPKRRWLQMGVAGFAFGNIMLFSIPVYLGLDSFHGPAFQAVFGCISLVLAAPVLVYSAGDYWRSAWLSLRQRVLTLDVPIALGLAALYGQSAFEIFSGRGEGYLDSMAGLVFFLLCGRAFQQKSYERLAFDRDYKCFFPLSVLRQSPSGAQTVAISELAVGDRLLLRPGELIPADARLLSDSALVDYSFVTGESEPVAKEAGDYLYAGGQQAGGLVEVETVKPVSQSYLTSLWNHDTFRKDRDHNLDTQTNRYSRRFTALVIAVALGAALFWVFRGDTGRALKAFASVLIVACPCALALAAPFALGTAQRLLARLNIFLKNGLVLERMAKVDAIVFDKTGTLTAPRLNQVEFHAAVPVGPRPSGRFETGDVEGVAEGFGGKKRRERLTPENSESGAFLRESEQLWVASLARQSTHPHARGIAEWLLADMPPGSESRLQPVTAFVDRPGAGISGRVAGHDLRLGSRGWLADASIEVPKAQLPDGSASWLSLDGRCVGAFVLSGVLRPDSAQLVSELGNSCELALASGDNPRERERFRELFGPEARLDFNQTPLDKLEFTRDLQAKGRTVMMVGDGLNDAGALRQSDVGVAVVEQVGVFSPASDVILHAERLPELGGILRLARRTARVVRISFGISAAYNLVGISIAAAGILSPLLCAVLMPLSSISVVAFATGATRWAAKKEDLA